MKRKFQKSIAIILVLVTALALFAACDAEQADPTVAPTEKATTLPLMLMVGRLLLRTLKVRV